MRKYIDDLDIKYGDTPQGWHLNDTRQGKWQKQREIYGFDERETWGLDYSFSLWLYERLCMYDEINIVNTDFHKFTYKDEDITLQDCIDKMIEGLKLYLITDEWEIIRNKEIQEKVDDVVQIFALCYRHLWW